MNDIAWIIGFCTGILFDHYLIIKILNSKKFRKIKELSSKVKDWM
jgi:hypothetical protein